MQISQEIFEGILGELDNIKQQILTLMAPEAVEADKELIEIGKRYGFKPKHFDKEFQYQGLTLALVDFDTEKSKPCIIEDVKTEKKYRMKAATVHTLLSESELESEEFEINDEEESFAGFTVPKLRRRVQKMSRWVKGCQFLKKEQLIQLLTVTEKSEIEQIQKIAQIKMESIYS